MPSSRQSDRSHLLAVPAVLLLVLVAGSAMVLATTPAGRAADAVATTGSPTETATGSPTGSPTGTPTVSESSDATASPTGSATASASPSQSATPTPTQVPTGDPGGDPLEDAVLRWGINDESNNRAFAPGTFNFFSAGLIPDPGKGGTTLPREQWRQSRGDVEIEKWDGARWREATWAGLTTTSEGETLGSPTAGTFSNHSIVFGGGTGTLDRDAGTATVSWDGDVTVLYYSGMSFFHLSDPELTVAGGRGTLTATLRGYASSVDDPEEWAPIPAREVVVADLPEVDLGPRGITVHPAYRGVRVDGVPQVTDGDDAGAFPQSYVDYMDRLGTAAFWYSSGAATDPFKVPLPLTVSYDAARAVPQPTPTVAPTPTPLAQPTPTPVAGTSAPPPTPIAAAPAAPPVVAAPTPQGATSTVLNRPVTQLAATRVAASPLAPGRGHPGWWVGGLLLLVAALVVAASSTERN